MVQKAVSLKPDNENYLNNMAFIFLKMGKVDEAIETARKSLLINQDFDLPLAILGEAYLRKGEYRMAQYFWQRYNAVKPEDLTSICAMIEIYDKHNKKNYYSHLFLNFANYKR